MLTGYIILLDVDNYHYFELSENEFRKYVKYIDCFMPFLRMNYVSMLIM